MQRRGRLDERRKRVHQHVYDGDPSFYEVCLTDPTQVVLIIMAYGAGAKPLGVVRLFNIHLPEGYAFLETMLADPLLSV